MRRLSAPPDRARRPSVPRVALSSPLTAGLHGVAVAGGPVNGWQSLGPNPLSPVGGAGATVVPSALGLALSMAGLSSPSGQAQWPLPNTGATRSLMIAWSGTAASSQSRVAASLSASEWFGTNASAQFIGNNTAAVSGYTPGIPVVQVFSISGSLTSQWTSLGVATGTGTPSTSTGFGVGTYGSGFDAPGLFSMVALWFRALTVSEAIDLVRNPFALLSEGN